MKLRVAVAAIAVALTLVGTVVGGDDAFPFGPFRMYATSARSTGNVRTAQVFGVLADGTIEPLDASDIGLRRAELEGQLWRFRNHPELLADLAGTDHVAVKLVERVRRVVDRKVQPGERVRLVAEWRR